jgi:hypothetical protein
MVQPEFGIFALAGGETSMGKEAQRAVVLNDEVQKKFDEYVTALTAMRYGPDGPPENTTFAEIEEFGHEVGRMVGRAVDQQLTSQHAEQFQKAAVCPTCQTLCELKPSPAERELQTCDGRVPIAEPVCHCSVCNRDFFPSACRIED